MHRIIDAVIECCTTTLDVERYSVSKAVSGINHTNRNNFTTGDYTYLSNMAYADLFPKLLNTETDCVKYSCLLAEDIDGCEGMPFRRFLADLIGEGREFDFSQFC